MTKMSRIFIFILLVTLAFGVMGYTVKGVSKDITLGLDLQGGFEILYQVVPIEKGKKVNSQLLSQTVTALEKRINVIGVSEPEIQIEGSDRIRVKLAGVTDQEQARRLLSTEANLSFRDVNNNKLLGGEDLKEGSAQVYLDDKTQKPVVSMQFKNPKKVSEATESVLGQPMVIWLDFEEGNTYAEETAKEQAGQQPKYISAPIVNDILSDSGVISSGYWDFDEAKELADLLNSGALPVKLKELSANSVGAKLGEKAMALAINAGYLAGILIILYMILFYRIGGIVAAITILAYVYLILLVFTLLEATLTLPGIAALILGVGMAVDANILTLERIKDEIRSGKTILSSFKSGSRRALGTIMDANITTVIAALVLLFFGSSAIQGFAIMLIVSIILSIATAVFASRLLMGLLVTSRAFDRKPRLFGVKESEINEL